MGSIGTNLGEREASNAINSIPPRGQNIGTVGTEGAIWRLEDSVPNDFAVHKASLQCQAPLGIVES